MTYRRFFILRTILSFITFIIINNFYFFPDFALYSSESISLNSNVSPFFDRTFIAKELFYFVELLFFNNIYISNFFFIVIFNFILYKYFITFKFFFNKTYFYLFTLLPSFLLWTSIYSKEMIFISLSILLLILIKRHRNGIDLLLSIILIYLIILFRIQFLPALIVVLIGGFISKIKLKKYFYLVYTVILMIGSVYFYINILPSLLPDIYSYFFYFEGNSNREWISWGNNIEFLKAIPIGLYTEIFKFLPNELLTFKLGSVFFLEGFLSIILLIRVIYKCKLQHFYSFWLLMIIVLVVNIPLNIFNPGSAIRYSCFLLFYVISAAPMLVDFPI